MIFKHGADWVRADFHLHTIKEPGASRKQYRAEFRDREGEFADEFINKLESEGIRVAAITNHNHFDLDEYKILARKGRDRNILILPGIEIGLRGGDSTVHTLIIFDPLNLNSGNDFINRFLTGQFPRGNPGEGDATSDDIAGCFGKVEALGESYFIVFAHVESDNGLIKEVKKTALSPVYEQVKDIWEKRVLGFQGVKAADSKWISQKLPDGIAIPAYVEGSDPANSIQEVGDPARGVCYLKVSELSYQSVRFALRDHVLRVRAESAPTQNRPTIHSVGIDGGKRGVALYQLSDNLNTLIGSRGSGKSLMIEALRWCLNIPIGKGDETYKSDLIHAFLDRGATVKVDGLTADGKPFEVSRSYTGKKEQPEPQITVSGEVLNVKIDSILPGVLYFGQKDLGERDKQSTENIFEQLLPAIPPELSIAADEALETYEQAIDTYEIAKKAQEEDDELKFEEQNLTEKLEAFKKLGVEGRLREITEFDQDLRRLRDLYVSLQQERKSFGQVYRSDDELESWDDILQSELNEELKPELILLRQSYDKAKSEIGAGIDSIEALEPNIAAIGKKLDDKLKEKQESFAEILREVDQPELDIDEYRKMVSRFAQIQETRTKTKEKKGKLESFVKSVVDTGRAWHASLKAITDYNREYIDVINKRLPKQINIHQKFQADEDSFRIFLENVFEGSGFNSNSYEALLASADHGLDLFIRREALKGTELTPKMSEKFWSRLNQNFKEILTFSPSDLRLIEYEGTKITELSLGKRAMALLLLLLSLDAHPIIILDQPEDDLDNETIHGFIVKPLIENKDRVQFIIATHNPNIPVLGDAEQVVACSEQSKGEYRESFGSLDISETKDAVINIMEGGKLAFEKRHDIYTLWAKPH